jgi:hypothetical protein
MQPLLCFSIDVEEDMPGWEIAETTTVSNVRALPRLADMAARLGVRPTYLVTYPVATDPEAARILRELHARGDCEIGTHLHPWNTPPFVDVPGRAGDERKHAYYMSELGATKFRAKLERLHAVLGELAGTPPRSFRAGRFGIDAPTLRELLPLGYEVDSSVTRRWPSTARTAARTSALRRSILIDPHATTCAAPATSTSSRSRSRSGSRAACRRRCAAPT